MAPQNNSNKTVARQRTNKTDSTVDSNWSSEGNVLLDEAAGEKGQYFVAEKESKIGHAIVGKLAKVSLLLVIGIMAVFGISKMYFVLSFTKVLAQCLCSVKKSIF